ncbi:hypothetical protein D3C84_870270 [compost metagenome]
MIRPTPLFCSSKAVDDSQAPSMSLEASAAAAVGKSMLMVRKSRSLRPACFRVRAVASCRLVPLNRPTFLPLRSSRVLAGESAGTTR